MNEKSKLNGKQKQQKKKIIYLKKWWFLFSIRQNQIKVQMDAHESGMVKKFEYRFWFDGLWFK